jgi:hypothetical protein
MKKSIASLLALSLGVFSTAAFAQSPGEIISHIQNLVHSSIAKGAKSRWSKLPESEFSCVNQKLRERGDNLETLIRRGVSPSDKRVAKVRSECRGSSVSRQFRLLENHSFKRSGQDIVITASNYHDCENACSKSSTCGALNTFSGGKNLSDYAIDDRNGSRRGCRQRHPN